MSEKREQAGSFADSMRRLTRAQKTSKGAPFYSVAVNRPLGRVLAAAAHQMGLTPNHVTLVSAGFTFTGIVLLALLSPGWPAAILVTTALVLGYALDAADGQLARLGGGGSPAGEWLDHIIDSGKIATLHLSVLISIYRHFQVDRWWLLIPVGFAAAYVVHFFGMLLTDLLTRLHTISGRTASSSVSQSRLMSILKLPTDYGVLCLSFVLLGVPQLFLVAYTALAIAMVCYTGLVLPKWYGRMRHLQ